MTISPGTHFDDPRFRGDERTPAQRMSDGDYYVADDELAALTKRAVRLLSLYEQVHPTDPDIARYLLAQVLGQVGECVDIRPPLRVDYGHNISIGVGSWANYGLRRRLPGRHHRGELDHRRGRRRHPRHPRQLHRGG